MYNRVEEYKKEFYFNLGLLSTKFSKMEYKLIQILGLLIVDNFVITNTIFEKNSLAQNLELLKKLNKYRSYEEKYIQNLIANIGRIKKDRNLFIHGIWGEPFEFENDILIQCHDPKIQYESIQEGEMIVSQEWSSSKPQEFRLTYIKKLIKNLDDIICCQDYFIEKLKMHTFD